MLSDTMRKNNKSKIDMREYCITVDYNDVQGNYSECWQDINSASFQQSGLICLDTTLLAPQSLEILSASYIL